MDSGFMYVMYNKFDINAIAKEMTREEFLKKAGGEYWCVSKYGFSRSNCRLDGENKNCGECFKKTVNGIKFKGEK